jgi:hypothetical protein
VTLLFMDGFDHYSNVLDKWTANDSMSLVSAAKRFTTGQGARSALAQGYIRKALATTYTTLISGFAFKLTSGFSNGLYIAAFDQGATTICRMKMNGIGQMFIENGSSTIIGAASVATQMSSTRFHYVEWKVLFSTTVGTVVVKLDGTTIFNLSGVNTGGANSDNVQIGPVSGGASGWNQDYDDFWVCDTSGSVNNDFLGDRRIYTLYPSGNGNYSQLARTGGTASGNYTAVQEAQQDSDTSYVSSATAGQIDSYAFDDLPATAATVNAVQFNQVARKDDAGTRQIAPFQRNVTTDSVGATSANLSSSYDDIRTISEVSLQTASAWTVSEINASEFGTKIIS